MSRYSSKSTLPLNLCAFARPLYELYVVMNLFRCSVRMGGASAMRNDLVAFDLDLQLLVSSPLLPSLLPPSCSYAPACPSNNTHFSQ